MSIPLIGVERKAGRSFSLKHIASIDLMSREQIISIIVTGIHILYYILQGKKIPNCFTRASGKLPPGFISLMAQASTGTRVSFDAAAALLGCFMPTKIDNLSATSSKKGEPIRHTINRLYLQAGINMFAIRSRFEGFVLALALLFDRVSSGASMLRNDISFFNAGEGERFHPTQVSLDLLAMVVWKLFDKDIKKDSGARLGHHHLVKAIEKFCRLKPGTQRKRIAEALDGLTICFVGDMKSRILYDYLALGRADANGVRKFNISFILVTPDFAKPDTRYLQDVQHNITDQLRPDLPFDVVYPLRWRFEDRPKEEQGIITELAPRNRITIAFLEALLKRERPAVVFEALPIDKALPSIEEGAEYHESVFCWAQAQCALAARAAAMLYAADCWKDEASVMESCWALPEPAPAPLVALRDPISLSEYHAQHKKQRQRNLVNVDNGSLIDHLPSDMGYFIEAFLRHVGCPAQIIVSSRLSSRDGLGDFKDMIWLPDFFLDEWNPQVLMFLDFLTNRRLTYNKFRKGDNVFEKFRSGLQGRVVGLGRCPRGVNPYGEDPECIDGHPEEIKVVPIFELSGTDFPRCECGYCKSIHTPKEMVQRIKKMLPAA